MLFNKNNNGTDEIKKIATWTGKHRYEHIYPALLLAKRKLINIIGKEIYNKTLAHYQSVDFAKAEPSDQEALLDELVYKMQYVMVNFAYSKNLDKDTVLWDSSGITVTWSENFRPAQQDALSRIGESLDRDGFEFLDLLIEFLNENPYDLFSEFKESLEKKQLSELFINDAEDFNFFFNINNSVSYFFSISDVIRRVQRTQIYSALGSDYYTKVKDYQEKRQDLEKVTNYVENIEDLPLSAPDGELYLVNSLKTYYKFNVSEWLEYAYDAKELLNLIKPALVDYVIYTKFISDISNLKANTKQIEVIRANSDFLKQKAEVSTAHIVEYIENKDITVEILDETVEETIGYKATNNSLML